MQQKTTNQETITIGASVGKEVSCSQCGKKGTTDEFFSYEGKNEADVYICKDCRALINTTLEKETKNPQMLGAVGLGVVASIIGGIIWYFITLATEKEIGYVAIGLGYLVGNGVVFGSGKRRGQILQMLAVMLTLITIFVANYFIYNYFANEYIQSHLDEFPGFTKNDEVRVPLFDWDFLSSFISPIGLLIYAIGAYVAFNVPKARKI